MYMQMCNQFVIFRNVVPPDLVQHLRAEQLLLAVRCKNLSQLSRHDEP
jgi:hypothetical protein